MTAIRKKGLYLISIMITITVIVMAISITMLYQVAFHEEEQRLIETVQSQARLMESVARFDQKHSGEHAFDNTLAQIREAHQNFKGFGETGEFTLAKLENNQIIFLLNHRHHDLTNPHPVAFKSNEAEAMSLALQGESGTLVGNDYRGQRVLAAYEPVANLNLGVVAKIDLKEIQAPFILAAWVAAFIATVLIFIGSWGFQRITTRISQQIEKSEQLFRSTFDHAGIGLAHVATDGGWLRVNSALCKILHYSAKDLLKITFQEITHPEDLEKDMDRLQQTIAGEIDGYSMEKRYIRKDGKTIHALLTVTLVRNDEGEADYFISAVEDITQQIELRDEIKDKSERLEIATNGTSDGLWLWDIKTNYEWHAPQWKRLLGYSESEIIPEKYSTWESRIHPDDKGRALSMLDKHLKENSPYDCEQRLQSKSGEYRWFRDRGIAIRDNSGTAIRMGGSIQDINELKVAESRLHTSNEKLEQALSFIDVTLDAQLDTFFLFNPATGKAIRWNKAFRDISGYSNEEIAMLPAPNSYYGQKDLQITEGLIQQIIDGEHKTIEMNLICKDGHQVPTEYIASAITDEKSQQKYIIAIGRDITERQQAARDLNDSNNALQLKNSDLQEAIATIKTISGLVPICAWCGNKIKDDSGEWVRLEQYFEGHTDAQITHGMCPNCQDNFSKSTNS